MSWFNKKVEQPSARDLDMKEIETALNKVVDNMKTTYSKINSRLDKMQSDIEKSFRDVGEDFESLAKDVEVLKSLASEDSSSREVDIPKPQKMYSRVTSDDVDSFESEKEDKRKTVVRKR
jgi:DNA anti-recombination protein RmuC